MEEKERRVQIEVNGNEINKIRRMKGKADVGFTKDKGKVFRHNAKGKKENWNQLPKLCV